MACIRYPACILDQTSVRGNTANNVKYSERWDACVKMYIGCHFYYCPLTVTSSGVGAALHQALSERLYKTISPERCGSVSLWCSTPRPYHTSPVQPPLASGAAEDVFQDRGPCMEMYP